MKNAKGKHRRRKLMRAKTCRLCENQIYNIDFKDVDLLKRYQTEGGRILSRQITGNCFSEPQQIFVIQRRITVRRME